MGRSVESGRDALRNAAGGVPFLWYWTRAGAANS